MNFIEKYHYHFLIILFLITYSISVYIVEYNKHSRINRQLVNVLETTNVEYKLIYNIYKKNAKILYSQTINKPNVLKIIADINETNINLQKDKLFITMAKSYKFSKKLGIKHIHFHLNNNKSFLNMHEKSISNNHTQNIKDFHKYKKKTSGFTKENLFYGYRFFHPLYYKHKKYIGNVEFSIYANEFKTFFENTIFIDSYFLLKKENKTIVDNKLKKYYDESFESNQYLQTKRDEHDNSLKLFIKNNKKIYQNIIKNKLNSKKAFAIELNAKNEYYIRAFIPIHRINSREVIAYFISTLKSPYIKNTYNDAIYMNIILFFFLLIVVYAIHKSLIYSHSLRQKIKEKTDELEASQQKIIEAKKMASLSTLVAGIAHEINTPIGLSITALSHFMEQTQILKKDYRDETMDEEEFANYLNKSNSTLELIFSNLVKAANLIKDFKQISINENIEEKRVINLKERFDKIIKTLNTKLQKKSVTVELNIDEKLELSTYSNALSIIVSNLILNSLLHAFNNTKYAKITIIVFQDKSDTFITYIDNGSGMNSEQIKNIYEPFYTTNRGSGGSGLGMHITFNLITQKLNGTINLQSKVGDGVKYTITIPN